MKLTLLILTFTLVTQIYCFLSPPSSSSWLFGSSLKRNNNNSREPTLLHSDGNSSTHELVPSHIQQTTVGYNKYLSKITAKNRQNEQNPYKLATKAESILKLMELSRNYPPDTISYTIVINAWSRSFHPDGYQKVLDLLQKMESNKNARPNAVTYSSVLNALARYSMQEKQGAIMAEKLLNRIDSSFLDVKCYSFVIDAWARSRYNDAAERAESILFRMIDVYERKDDDAVAPNTFCFAGVINAWSKSSSPLALEKAEVILNKMEEIYNREIEELGESLLIPNVHCYTGLINVISKSKRDDAPQRAELLLEKMVKMSKANPEVMPNAFTYAAVMNCWASSKQKQAPRRAEAILKHMNLLNNSGRKDISPVTLNYNACIDAWAFSSDPEGALRAEALLKRMWKDYLDNKMLKVKPNKQSLNGVLLAWEERASLKEMRDFDPGPRAEAVLKIFEKYYESKKGGDIDLCPDRFSYNTVLNIYAKVSQFKPDYANRAELLLNKMTVNAGQKNLNYPRPNALSYNIVVGALARSRAQGAPERAEILLNQMEEAYATGTKKLKPTYRVYTSVIDAWSKSANVEGSGRRAERILNHMVRLYKKTKDPDFCPTRISFNCAINSWSSEAHIIGAVAAKRAESLMSRMVEQPFSIEPDIKTWNNVLTAWSRTKDFMAVQNVRLLFNKLVEAYESSGRDKKLKPDEFSLLAILDSYIECQSTKDNPIVVLDFVQSLASKYKITFTGRYYHTCIKLLVQKVKNVPKEKLPMLIDRADEILKQLERGLRRKVVGTMKPDQVSYGSVLKIAQSDPQRAQTILDRMNGLYQNTGDKSVQPTTICYNIVLDAWYKSGLKDSSFKCQHLLNQMIKSKDPITRPNSVSYGCVISAWSRSDSSDASTKAEDAFLEMEKPNIIAFNSVLNSYARTNSTLAAQHAEQLLFKIEGALGDRDDSLRPDNVSYSTVAKAWCNVALAQTSSKKVSFEALEKAEMIFFSMSEKGLCDSSVTLNFLLRAYVQLGSASKAEKLLVRSLRGGIRPNTMSFRIVREALESKCNKEIECEKRVQQKMRRYLDLVKPSISTI